MKLIYILIIVVCACSCATYQPETQVYLKGIYTSKPYIVKLKQRNLYWIQYERNNGTRYGFWVQEDRLTTQKQELNELID